MPNPSPFPGFPPQALTFLRRLRRNNRRDWFQSHREEYEQHVKSPMTALVLALGQELQRMAPELASDPAQAIYRIYRDVRFSPDKSPYKTHVAALFSVRGVPKHTCAALYFHISPEEVEIAGGVYMPESQQLSAIRRHIADHYPELQQILAARPVKRLFGSLWGEQLTRAPKGFPADHPAADLLRYKQWLVDVAHPARLALEPRLYPTLTGAFRAMMPLVRFLNTPLLAAAGVEEFEPTNQHESTRV